MAIKNVVKTKDIMFEVKTIECYSYCRNGNKSQNIIWNNWSFEHRFYSKKPCFRLTMIIFLPLSKTVFSLEWGLSLRDIGKNLSLWEIDCQNELECYLYLTQIQMENVAKLMTRIRNRKTWIPLTCLLSYFPRMFFVNKMEVYIP